MSRAAAASLLLWPLALLATALAGCGHLSRRGDQAIAQAAPPPDPANRHTVTVKFDYDFSKTPACPAKSPSKTCVKRFDVYDVSGGRYKLFTIPAPEGATGMVKGITGRGPERTFEPGTHLIAVTAENATGVESDTNAAKISVEVKRKIVAPADAAPAKH